MDHFKEELHHPFSNLPFSSLAGIIIHRGLHLKFINVYNLGISHLSQIVLKSNFLHKTEWVHFINLLKSPLAKISKIVLM